MNYSKRLNESHILENYGNEATTMVLAGLCEKYLPGECYTISNRHDRYNCSVRLFAAGGETPHGLADDSEICGENIWLQVQTAIDWDENAEISVEVDDDADESEVEDAWEDAAMDYVFGRGVREDALESVVAALRKTCGVEEEVTIIQGKEKKRRKGCPHLPERAAKAEVPSDERTPPSFFDWATLRDKRPCEVTSASCDAPEWVGDEIRKEGI